MSTDKHIAEMLMEYAFSLGARKLNELPGLWISKVDDQWTIKCNGHEEEVDGVPAFSWYIEYNGWPAGILSIMGDGVLCAGEGGNEHNLKIAIERAMTLKQSYDR